MIRWPAGLPLRLRAFLLHLFCSAALAMLAVLLVFRLWYPSPLDQAVGVASIFLLLLFVDVILGPVLTLIVFKVAKKSLRFDLTVIVLLQLAAFGYGMAFVMEGRPVWLVFSVDRFEVVRANEYDRRHLDLARPEYRQPSWLGPQWVAAAMPTDIEKRNTLTFEAAFAGLDLQHRVDFYQPLTASAAEIRAKAKNMDALLEFNTPAAVASVRARFPQADAWLPLMSRVQPMTVLLRRETAEVLAVVDLTPWN